MKIRFISTLSAVALFAISTFAAPVPGLYVGVVTVTKNLGRNLGVSFGSLDEGLSSVYTLKAQAQVFPDGSITILPTVVESPTAATDPSSDVIHATPVSEPVVTVPEAPWQGNNYVIDAQLPAYLTIRRNTFEIYYETDRTLPSNGGALPTIDLSRPYTTFKFRFVLREKFKPLIPVPQAAN